MSVLGAVLRREWSVNTRAYRIGFCGANFLSAIFAMAVSLGIAAVLLLIAYVNVHRAEALAQERGSLVLY